MSQTVTVTPVRPSAPQGGPPAPGAPPPPLSAVPRAPDVFLQNDDPGAVVDRQERAALAPS